MKRIAFCLLSCALSTLGCSSGGGGSEAPSIELPVLVSSGGLTTTDSDLGYTVEVRVFRAAIADIEFSIGGEVHTESGAAAPASLTGDVPLRHPGHSQSGEVTGELPGSFIVDWTANGTSLGLAEIIVGSYESANFTFRVADSGDGLAGDDPLLGHTLHIEGSADNGGGPIPFRALLDVDAGTQMAGAPFEFEVTAQTQTNLSLEVVTQDPFENDTLFDGVDFAALPLVDDGNGGMWVDIAPGQEPHNILRRTAQTHDHYRVDTR